MSARVEDTVVVVVGLGRGEGAVRLRGSGLGGAGVDLGGVGPPGGVEAARPGTGRDEAGLVELELDHRGSEGGGDAAEEGCGAHLGKIASQDR